ncbi:MAG: slipin family protein [Parcubacteria group bacterium]|nr:slipin family protein [Parcubacteria group bacterium]
MVLFNVVLVVGIILFIALIRGLRVVKEYERGVVLNFGKYAGTREPGLTWIFVLFGIQEMIIVDIRINSTEIPQQEVITKDNVPVGINAVVYFHVLTADKAILKIRNYNSAIIQYAQASLRDVIGGVELDTLLSEREKIAEEMKKGVDTVTAEWGINITDIRIQDIELPADMKRVMAKQAESERERRAIVIQSQGEYEAAEKLAQAAGRLSATPGGLALRTLETIEKINPDPSKTVIFALPIEFMQGIQSLTDYFKDKK